MPIINRTGFYFWLIENNKLVYCSRRTYGNEGEARKFGINLRDQFYKAAIVHVDYTDDIFNVELEEGADHG